MVNNVMDKIANDYINDRLELSEEKDQQFKILYIKAKDKWKDTPVRMFTLDLKDFMQDPIPPIEEISNVMENRLQVRNLLEIHYMVCRDTQIIGWNESCEIGDLKKAVEESFLDNIDLFMVMRDLFFAISDLKSEGIESINLTPTNVFLKRTNRESMRYKGLLANTQYPFSFLPQDQNFLPINAEKDSKKFIFSWGALYFWSLTRYNAHSYTEDQRESMLSSKGVNPFVKSLLSLCLKSDTTQRIDYQGLGSQIAELYFLSVLSGYDDSEFSLPKNFTGHQSKIFTNGDLYVGDWLEGKPHGSGIYSWGEDNTFEGRFEEGLPQGSGIFTLSDGSVFEGDVRAGLFEGTGVYKFINGNCYRGEFKQDMMEGEGEYTYQNGILYFGMFTRDLFGPRGKILRDGVVVYDGEFRSGVYHGKGTKVYSNGDEYEGGFLLGFKHGTGSYRYVNKDLYEGGYKWGRREGRGCFVFANGSRYEGEFMNGKRHGNGVFEVKGKFSYEGGFAEDRFHGQGDMVYFAEPNKERIDDDINLKIPSLEMFSRSYVGSFKEGKRASAGKLVYWDNSKYEGSFVNGFKQGQGTYEGVKGVKYKGGWLFDVPDGKGKKTDIDGHIIEGEFRQGKPHGTVTIIFKNGDLYEGEMFEGKKQGKGKMTYQQGAMYSGEWQQDVFEGEGTFRDQEGVQSFGNWKQGRRHGNIITRWPNGKRFEGSYENDKKIGTGVYFMPDGTSSTKVYS